jgi:hypothetical protein
LDECERSHSVQTRPPHHSTMFGSVTQRRPQTITHLPAFLTSPSQRACHRDPTPQLLLLCCCCSTCHSFTVHHILIHVLAVKPTWKLHSGPGLAAALATTRVTLSTISVFDPINMASLLPMVTKSTFDQFLTPGRGPAMLVGTSTLPPP